MSSLAVFADYLDYTGRVICATARDEAEAAARLRFEIRRLGATNVRGPFAVTRVEDDCSVYTPRDWPIPSTPTRIGE